MIEVAGSKYIYSDTFYVHASKSLKLCCVYYSDLRGTSLGPRPKPTPAWIASSITRGDTGSDPRWGWFGSGAETREAQECGITIRTRREKSPS